ncbi:Pentalenene oxygenase [Pirellulimonas nuda]|uniref:Pentalenene oxygenase n=2 Tax=Pirellulimonas nuda TaxID=2528009 RepID=A0A518D7A1_9BACT|nr:Pentalenene oxygenase [Pirellulimonas nuda]
MRRDPVRYLSRIAHKYGDLSTFLLLTQRVYLVNSPELIHEVLVRQKEKFVKSEWQMRVIRPVLGDGLLTSGGKRWFDDRRLIQRALRADSMEGYAQQAVETTEQMIAGWGESTRVDLADAVTELSMSVSIASTLGIDPGPEADELAQAVRAGAEIFMKEIEEPVRLPAWMIPRRTRRRAEALATIDRFVGRAIARRRADPNAREDLLSLLLSVTAEAQAAGAPAHVLDKMVRDQAVTMMIAGNHSVSGALAWFWVLALSRPEVYDRLKQEVRDVVGQRSPEPADLPRLAYTKQVLQESLRLIPAAWVLFTREVTQDTALGEFQVKRGGWVVMSPYVTQRDPRFFPDPERFDPERFSPERIDEIPAGAYFPFGHGPHACIGERMAMAQMTMVLATLLSRCDFQADPGSLSLEAARDLAIRPKQGCPVQVKVRKPELAGAPMGLAHSF